MLDFFLKNHYFSIFKHFRGFLLRLYLRGVLYLLPINFSVLLFLIFRQMPSYLSRMLKKNTILLNSWNAPPPDKYNYN